MERAAGEVIQQGGQRLRVDCPNLQDLDLIRDGYRATGLIVTDHTRQIVGIGGVVFPAARIGVKRIKGGADGIGRNYGLDLKDRIGKVDKALELIVAICGSAANQFDRIGLANS